MKMEKYVYSDMARPALMYVNMVELFRDSMRVVPFDVARRVCDQIHALPPSAVTSMAMTIREMAE